MSPRTAPAGAVSSAVRGLARIDRSAIAPVAGAIAVLPVVTLFAAGVTWWGAKAAVTLALGAHLVAIASTVKSSKSSYSVLALNAVVLAGATFVGSATESHAWLHGVTLMMLCFAGGLLVALGPLLAVIGTQSIIAFLVFGRFPEGPGGALQLAGLVLLGAMAETVFLSVVRWPPNFRRQRDSIATAFRELGSSAREGGEHSTVLAGVELDFATNLLSAHGLIGRDDERSLRGVVDEARRTRIGLAALSGLRRRLMEASATHPAQSQIEAALHHLAVALDRAGQAVDSGRSDPGITPQANAVDAAAEAALESQPGPGGVDLLVLSCVNQLHALAGQLRAVEKLLAQQDTPRWHVQGYPTSRLRAGWVTVTDWFLELRANLTMTSPALRHALRLATSVPLADLVAHLVGLPRSYWVPLTVAVVLKADFGSLFTRGIGRVVGTCVGVGLAGFFIAEVHPDRAGIIVAVGLTAWGAYSLFQSSFALGSSFIAAIVLLLLSVTQIDTTTTAADRLLDTVLGGAVALVAYLVWPTWSSGQARHAIARLVAAQQSYLASILSTVLGDDQLNSPQSHLARQVRLAWTEAQATVSRSVAEPTKWRIDGDAARSLMGTLLRITQAAHALRLCAAPSASEPATLALRNLKSGLDRAMSEIGSALEHNHPVAPLPPLRELHGTADSGASDPTMLLALDEIVDAIDSVGHLLEDNPLERLGKPSH